VPYSYAESSARAGYAIKPTCRANNRDVALFMALLPSINLIDEAARFGEHARVAERVACAASAERLDISRESGRDLDPRRGELQARMKRVISTLGIKSSPRLAC